MYNTKSKFHKGSSVLVSTLITAAASAMIGYGITKMIAMGIDSINNQQIKMQAQQYAASRINVLRSVRYDNLAGMTKRQIGTTDYYEEVTKTGDSDGSTGDAYQVAIYKGADSNNPVTTMNFYRSNPGILLDNQVESASGNADSSALIQSALKDYTNSQFGEGSESESSSKAMGIKSFTSYVDGLLSKYRINAVAAWNIDSSDTFNQNGSNCKPIYIDKGSRYNYAAQGSVTYSMSGNSEGYLATVTPAGNGLYYVDYIEKDTPDENTGGSTGGGNTGGSTVAPSVGKFDGCRWDYSWDYHNGEESTFVDRVNGYFKFITCSNTKYIAMIAGGNLEDADDTGSCSVDLFNSSFESLDMINGESWTEYGYGLDTRVLVEVSPNTTYYASYDCSADILGITDSSLTVLEVDPTTVTINSDGKTAQIKDLQDAGLIQYKNIVFYKFL